MLMFVEREIRVIALIRLLHYEVSLEVFTNNTLVVSVKINGILIVLQNFDFQRLDRKSS